MLVAVILQLVYTEETVQCRENERLACVVAVNMLVVASHGVIACSLSVS